MNWLTLRFYLKTGGRQDLEKWAIFSNDTIIIMRLPPDIAGPLHTGSRSAANSQKKSAIGAAPFAAGVSLYVRCI